MVTTGPNTGDEVSVPGRQDVFPHMWKPNPAWQERRPQLWHRSLPSCGPAPHTKSARGRERLSEISPRGVMLPANCLVQFLGAKKGLRPA